MLAVVFAFTMATSSAANHPDILLVGDSTVTNGAGWGGAFARLLKPGVACQNAAQSGSSTKSYLKSYWTEAIACKPRYVLIQFGHNDMPGKGPERETDPATTYRENLQCFVREAREAGTEPILVTSVTRRTFDADGRLIDKLAPYVDAMRVVADEMSVPLLDLHAASREEIERLGPQGSAPLGPTLKNGQRDPTHLSPEGAELTARLVASQVRERMPALANLLR